MGLTISTEDEIQFCHQNCGPSDTFQYLLVSML